MPKFKVGDCVKLIRSPESRYGNAAVVTYVNKRSDMIYIKFSDGYETWFQESDLQLVKEANP